MRLIYSILILSIVLVVIVFLFPGKKTMPASVHVTTASCSAATCGAIDPVNDPDYNVREVIKNTILLEQHLSDANKYCKTCITKHFLLSIGLLEEAVWMAGENSPNLKDYTDSVDKYQSLFKYWHVNMDDTKTRLHVLGELREWRRQSMVQYYFDGVPQD